MRKLFSALVVAGVLIMTACVPKEDIQFLEVKNIVVTTGPNGQPLLRGEALFYNPNKIKMKLRKADIEVLVNDKKSALVNQDYDIAIPAKGNFTVPVEAQLTLKEIGLMDAIAGLFGGRKYKVQFLGTIYASVRGVRVKVPVNHTEETKLKF